MHTEIDGTWAIDGKPTARHRVDDHADLDTTVTVTYTLTPGPKLALDQPQDPALGGTEFQLVPDNPNDPTLDTAEPT